MSRVIKNNVENWQNVDDILKKIERVYIMTYNMIKIYIYSQYSIALLIHFYKTIY